MRKHTTKGKPSPPRPAGMARAGGRASAWACSCRASCWAAGPNAKETRHKSRTQNHYLVSAILREGVQDFTFRLVHSLQSASGVDEAIGIFTRLALEKYPGYAVAQTTVTDIVPAARRMPPEQTGQPPKAQPDALRRLPPCSATRATTSTPCWSTAGCPASADEALGRVLRDVKASYPLYTPVSTLVTELDLALAGCPAPR